MKKCEICGQNLASKVLRACVDCIKKKGKGEAEKFAKEVHKSIRTLYNLPANPPQSEEGIICDLCSNQCQMKDAERSFCGLRENKNGKLKTIVPKDSALLYAYSDPLPTNCCASWFCDGSSQYGRVNMASFFYGCNFDCLFCQNASHKNLDAAHTMSMDDFVSRIKDRDDVFCVCFFGGSPEPQLDFAVRASEKILEKKNVKICWEWNGCGNNELVKRAAALSKESGGIVKFDLKAFDAKLSQALSGVSNERAYENFRIIGRELFEGSDPPVLTATTLMVPYYIDQEEVENIASYIAAINPNIPYSLLVFHPDFCMRDLPVTSREQVERCQKSAQKHLKNVHIGNKHLL